jgi:hypothetical protein
MTVVLLGAVTSLQVETTSNCKALLLKLPTGTADGDLWLNYSRQSAESLDNNGQSSNSRWIGSVDGVTKCPQLSCPRTSKE